MYSSQDINSLIISITDETTNISYILENVEDGNYTNSALIAEVGHTYTLNFAYNDLPITSTTIVPEGPTDVEYSDNSIGIMTPKTRMGMGIEITWSNDEGNYYIVEGSTTSVQPINYSYDEDEWPEKSFKLDYTQGNSATLNSSQFQYYGKYEISLIRIQSEYVIMSQGSSNTSTSLVDIRGNIDGGYGIFTGINREKKQITIYKESSPF